MDIIYGDLQVTGDFELRNIKELGYDRDFILRPPHPVVNLAAGDLRLQLVAVSRIVLRAALTSPEVTCHFLAAEDRHSAIANFTFQADRQSLEIAAKDGQTVLRLAERSNQR